MQLKKTTERLFGTKLPLLSEDKANTRRGPGNCGFRDYSGKRGLAFERRDVIFVVCAFSYPTADFPVFGSDLPPQVVIGMFRSTGDGEFDTVLQLYQVF